MRSPSTGSGEDSSSALFPADRMGIRPQIALPVGGLQMYRESRGQKVMNLERVDREQMNGEPISGEPEHDPVMVEEVEALFASVPPGVVVDATVGAAGHSAAILRSRPDLGVLGFDEDVDALSVAGRLLAEFGGRAVLEYAHFGDIGRLVSEARAAGRGRWPSTGEDSAGASGVSGVLFDLGMSSIQLDRPARGFSFRNEAPLDMRMDQSRPTSALELVNEAQQGELEELFAANGEVRLARRLARAIASARPLTTTTQLAEVVARSVPAAARRRGHPARRVFQALRIAVNDEADQLSSGLPQALELLAPAGRCVVISYHSGEDRFVKQTFAEAASGGCKCPPGLPCVCGAEPRFQLVFRGSRQPSPQEIARNGRASSAKLRAIYRFPEAPSMAEGA